MKRALVIAIATIALFTTLGGTTTAQASGGGTLAWGWQLDEWWTQLGYTGQVWRTPSRTAVDGGVRKYCSSAWLRFYAGSPGNRDTGNLYAVQQTSNPSYYLRTKDYWDDISWDPGYKTIFKRGFTLKVA